MRIGIDMRMAGEDFGIGRYSLELVRRVVARDKKNKYTLFTRNPEFLQRAGISAAEAEFVKADFRHYGWEEQTSFYRMISKGNFDLFHFLNFNVPLLYKKPFISTIHDLVHHKLPGNKQNRALHRYAYKAVIKHAAKDSKKVITVSNYSKREIAEEFKLPPEKIAVIYEAADPLPVSESEIIETQQKFRINKPYIVFVGVMERKKNIAALTRALDILKGEYRLNIQLVLAGKPDKFYPEVLEEAVRIKYRKDLIITGPVSDIEKYALYKGSLAFVSASLYEGFGLPGVEAMSMGIPLIVSNTEVFNEVYDNGAIYFDPHNPEDIAQKINLLVKDNKYRELVANNAYQRAHFFSWDKAADETLAVYNGLL